MTLDTDNSGNFKSRYPDHVYPTTTVAVQFLLEIGNRGPITVVTIPVGGSGARAQTYDTGNLIEVEAMRSFIAFHETQPSQVFYLANVAQPKMLGVPGNDDMVLIRLVVLDFDPDKDKPLEEERDRLRRLSHRLLIGPLQPRAIVDTGGGMQVVYQLLEPIPVDADSIAMIETLMKSLARSLGADTATCKVKNLFRVPGTFNWPTAAKKKAGRERTVSGIWHSGGPRCSLTDLQALAVVRPEDIQEIVIEFDVDDQDVLAVFGDPEALPGRILDTIRLSTALQKAVLQPALAPGDRSGADNRLCHAMAHVSMPAGDMALVLSAYGAKTAEMHGRGDGGLYRYVISTVKRAIAEASPDRFFQEVMTEAETIESAAQQRRHLDRLKPVAFSKALEGLFDEERESLVTGFLRKRETTVLYGHPGAGKTFVALDLAFRISRGDDWNGRKTFKSAVVYIAAESPFGIRYRMKALSDRFGDSSDFYLIASTVNLYDRNVDLKALVDNIAGLGVDIGMIVIDTLARAMVGGNENSTQDMGALIANGDILRDRFDANIVWVHHSGKNEARGARGSSSLQAATDTEIEVFGLAAGGVLRTTKMRDAEPLDYRFRLHQILVGKMPGGEEVTSCVVNWLENPRESYNALTPGSNALRMVEQVLRMNGMPMTLKDIMADAANFGLQFPVKMNSLGRALNRSCDSEIEIIFTRQLIERSRSQRIFEYGLVNW